MEPTCVHCGSDKEPYFSRSEPMGDYCSECGHNFYERGTSETDRTERRWRDYLLLNVDDIFDFARRLERERDEWKAKYIQQNKDLRCEMMDPNGTIWDHAKKLQDENKAIKEQLDFERELNKHKAVADAIGIGEAVGESVKDRIDALQEQLDAAIMLGKMQERRHERELEQVREQYRLSSVCRELKAENEKLKQKQP